MFGQGKMQRPGEGFNKSCDDTALKCCTGRHVLHVGKSLELTRFVILQQGLNRRAGASVEPIPGLQAHREEEQTGHGGVPMVGSGPLQGRNLQIGLSAPVSAGRAGFAWPSSVDS